MRRATLVLFLGICSFTGGFSAFLLAPHLTTQAIAQSDARKEFDSAGLLHLSDRFEAVARKVSPAVVAVEAVKPAIPGTGGNAGSRSRQVEESGSGVLIRVNGEK